MYLSFLNSANLICQGMYISNYVREFLGFRDNESRLYMYSVGTEEDSRIDRNMKKEKKFIVCFVRSYMYFTLK